jgi:LacI family transcriptional regulator
MATQKDVAKRAGVSFITVSRCINGSGYVSDDTRERVKKAIEELNYHPDSIGQALQQKTVRSIGVVVPPFSEIPTYGADYYNLFLEGADAACREAGFDIVYSMYRSEARPDYLRLFFQRKIAGVILFIPDLRVVDLNGLAENRVPCVVYGERPTDGRFSWVDADDDDAFYRITTRLAHAGKRRFGFVGGLEWKTCAANRRSGFLRAMRDCGIPDSEYREYPGDFTVAAGIAAMERAIELGEVPEALVCANDLMALGAIKAAKRASIAIPGRLTVSGYDDIAAIEIADPPLTSIRPPVREMGAKTVETLVSLVRAPDEPRSNILFPSEIVLRDSTGNL